MPQCNITIIDNANCIVSGLRQDHLDYLYEEFAVFAPNYRYNPKFKFGAWDGKVHFFSKTGVTYVNLLGDIVPILIKQKNAINIIDHRTAVLSADVPHITKDFFSHIINTDTNAPWEIRPYQVDLVNTLIDFGAGIGIAGTGAGKALALDAKILTPTGWKLNGDMRPNDLVLTSTGQVTTVVDVFPQPLSELYNMRFHDGTYVQCCIDHLWQIIPSIQCDTVVDTGWIVELMRTESVYIPLVDPIPQSAVVHMIEPYEFGRMLAGGIYCDCFCDLNNDTCDELSRLNLCGAVDMFIPDEYITDSIDNRISLIQGLLSKVATRSAGGYVVFDLYSKELANGVVSIVQSLGGLCVVSVNTDESDTSYSCMMTYPRALFNIAGIEYAHEQDPMELTRRITSIESIGFKQSQCISIADSTGLYVTNDYIVTHNTSMVAALVKSYELADDLRSIIIVPNKSLTKQTFREYEFFELDVGEYSGTAKTLDHQHIVSTWQALQHNPVIVRDFDVVVVDECHGARGRVISDLMTKHGINIPFKFGVTGTMPKDPAELLTIQISLGEVLCEIPAHQLIADGYLAELDIDIIQYISNLKPQYADYLDEYQIHKTTLPKLTYKQFKNSYFPDYPSEKHYIQNEPERLQWMADYIMAESLKGNVFCLTIGIAFGKRLAKLIPGAIFLYGKDDVADRDIVYTKFKDHDDMIVIANVKIASTGLDIKRIFNLVIIDIGKSFTTVIQSIGRGLRKALDKDAIHVTDIGSDFYHAKRHMRSRIVYYKEAKYKFNKTIVDC